MRSPTLDRRNHHSEPGQRPFDGPALRPDRRRTCPDFRADGRGELRPWRIPDDRDVRDVLSVRFFCRRSPAVGAVGRSRAVRIWGAGLPSDRALCSACQGQCRHGADLFDLWTCDRDARLAQYFFTPDYRSITHSWLGGKTISIAGIFLPVPQLFGAGLAIAAFVALYFFINRTDFGRA